MNLEDALGGWPSGGKQQPQGGTWPGQQPANPTWPGDQSGGGGAWPGQPGQPSQPSWPGQPNQPSQPSQPSWPGQPGQPSQPSWPGQPSQPSQPGPGPGPGFGPAPQKIMTAPYTLPEGVHDKLLITIVGTIKPNANKIAVDMLKLPNDLAFHFNPRFNENGRKVIVRNSRIGNKWGKEERECSGHFPFTQGQPFEMKIMCATREFKVAVNNSHLLSYQHRISDLKNIKQVNIYGDLTLSEVRREILP